MANTFLASSLISFQAASLIGASCCRIKSMSFVSLHAPDAERSVRLPPGLLDLGDRFLGEEIGAEFVVPGSAAAAQPLEEHGGVLDLLVAVVGEDGAQARRSSATAMRWSYQSTASSSSCRLFSARCRSLVSAGNASHFS